MVLSFSSGPGVNFNQTSNIKCFYNVRLEWIILKANSKFFTFILQTFSFFYLFVRQKILFLPFSLLLFLRSIDEKSTICLVWNKISRRSLGVVKYDFIDSCQRTSSAFLLRARSCHTIYFQIKSLNKRHTWNGPHAQMSMTRTKKPKIYIFRTLKGNFDTIWVKL